MAHLRDLFDFLFPQVLEETRSSKNGIIKIFKSGKEIRMTINGTTQSANYQSKMGRTGYWGKLTEIVFQRKPEAQSFLVIGLGGATIQQLIFQHIPKAKITTIEWDEEVIKLSKKYFEAGAIPDHNIICASAQDVLKNPGSFGITQKFDCVIPDTYIGPSVHMVIDYMDFLNQVKALLVTNGLVIFNILVSKKDGEGLSKIVAFVKKVFSSVETKVIKYPVVSDNFLISGLNKN